jgi:glucose-6-phosphate isomerase
MKVSFTIDSRGADSQELIERLVEGDALGELILREGRMAELATEAGDVKLDWIDGLHRALEREGVLDEVAYLARSLLDSGMRHLIWSGMGGSVQVVRCLLDLGWIGGTGLTIHPLDSTDPRVLSRLIERIGKVEIGATGMVAVAMGMTSEEPIAHLRWFESVLKECGATKLKERFVVMSLPGSYLDTYAKEHDIRSVAIQLDGESHTSGRMSAPSTRVFLFPVALSLNPPSEVFEVARRCEKSFGLSADMDEAARAQYVRCDPFVALACFLAAQLLEGRDMVLFDADASSAPLVPWIEQVIEESLCKNGRGLLTFCHQRLAPRNSASRLVRIVLRTDDLYERTDATAKAELEEAMNAMGEIPTASLAMSFDLSDAVDRLGAAGRCFLGWSLTVAVIGYLSDLSFAGQPGVEAYKRYARELRDAPGPLPYPRDDLVCFGREPGEGRARGNALWFGALAPALLHETKTSLLSTGGSHDAREAPSIALCRLLETLQARGGPAYLDLTINGEPDGPGWEDLRRIVRSLANDVLGIPFKIRCGPRDYHSTEQSEVDGPPGLLSLRVAVRELPEVPIGDYDNRYFQAQSLGTVFAMRDAGRAVVLALLENDAGVEDLLGVLEDTAACIATRSDEDPSTS